MALSPYFHSARVVSHQHGRGCDVCVRVCVCVSSVALAAAEFPLMGIFPPQVRTDTRRLRAALTTNPPLRPFWDVRDNVLKCKPVGLVAQRTCT